MVQGIEIEDGLKVARVSSEHWIKGKEFTIPFRVMPAYIQNYINKSFERGVTPRFWVFMNIRERRGRYLKFGKFSLVNKELKHIPVTKHIDSNERKRKKDFTETYSQEDNS